MGSIPTANTNKGMQYMFEKTDKGRTIRHVLTGTRHIKTMYQAYDEGTNRLVGKPCVTVEQVKQYERDNGL